MKIKLSVLIFFTIYTLISCKNEKDTTTLKITLSNFKPLDSIVIYDKYSSWKPIKSVLFTNSADKTISIKEVSEKYYSFYYYSQGTQKSLGEYILNRSENQTVELNQTEPIKSLKFKGSLSNENNFLVDLCWCFIYQIHLIYKYNPISQKVVLNNLE